jgi:hypothetical protein
VSSGRAAPSAARTARILHGALFAGTVVALVVLASLRTAAAVPPVSLPEGGVVLIRALVLTLAAGGTLGLRVVRRTLPDPPAPRALDEWWTANLGKAMTLWVFPDGVGVAGAVAYFLSGDGLVFALAAGWALAMFVVYAPGRLTGV